MTRSTSLAIPLKKRRERDLPKIYEYSDFRIFLLDAFKARRAGSRAWTFRNWARKLGLKSSSTLTMILQGQRNPGPELAQAFATTLEMKPAEAKYFFDLIGLEKSKSNPHLRFVLLDRLQKQSPKKSFRFIDRDSFAIVSNWYCYAIREMVDMKGFREDLDWIQKRLLFKVTKKDIAEAIESLCRVGLLERDASGTLRYSQGTVTTANDLHDEGLKRFHEQVLENAKAAVRLVPPPQREISGVTFALTKDNLPRAKEILRHAYQEILNISAKSEGDAVFQLETALYPLTELGEATQ